MTAWSLTSVSLLAHGVHYALVGVGLVGVSWLLLPQLVGTAPDEHDRRVAALRARAAAGQLGTLALPPTAVRRSRAETLHLPLAVVASACAAGVHAAMGPAHLEQATLFGLFFGTSALAQLAWSGRALTRTTPALLRAGIALNLGCVGLWALTRTWGLPLGLMPVREPVGPWDLAAVTWELVVVAACAALLRAVPPTPYAGPRLPAWVDWHRGATTAAVLSVGVLLALSLSGVGE